ncbi:MAG: nitrite reductase/ring-hydroxylating ferredoxin subunit [Oceanicoccus sp.]|jgi:nitrite reductase/ring-hydroxylating ferredoxin subunit
MSQLCHIDRIEENKAKSLAANDMSLLAVKRDGEIYLYHNKCPHLGVELNWLEDQFMDMDGMLIQCATHGALFLVEDGECVAGPCQGERLQPVDFIIKDDHIHLS